MQPENGTGIHVFITNTYLPILNKLKDTFGGSVTLRNKSNPKHRTIYQWRISSKEGCRKFLQAILPFLIEKKEQAILGIQFCDLPALKVNRFSKRYEEVLEQRKVRIDIANKLKRLKRIDYLI